MKNPIARSLTQILSGQRSLIKNLDIAIKLGDETELEIILQETKSEEGRMALIYGLYYAAQQSAWLTDPRIVRLVQKYVRSYKPYGPYFPISLN